MASLGELEVNKDYEFTLMGAQRWVQAARVTSLFADAIVLRLDGGAQITVPRSAIASVRPLPGGKGAAGEDRRSGPGARTTGRAGSGSSSSQATAPSVPDSSESFYQAHIQDHGSQFSASWLRELRARILAEASSSPAGLTELRRSIADALQAVAAQWVENDFERHHRAHQESRQLLSAASAALDSSAEKEYFGALLAQLHQAVEAENSDYLRSAVSSPDFVKLAADEHFYVGADQTFLLTVPIGLPAGDAQVESVQLVVGNSSDLRAIGQTGFIDQLRPGETREVVQRLKVSDLALGVGQASIPLSLRYRCASGRIDETPVRYMIAVLEPARKFVPVGNPYSRYSGGTPVEEESMFFGRRELLARIHGEIATGPLGQCFVLYGQKRSGKSSVLRQLQHHLRPPNLPVYLSLGSIDTSEAERSFVQACIDALYQRLVFDFDLIDVLDEHWPNQRQVATSPIASFRRSVLASSRILETRLNWREVRPIFLIDEFTYVYEYIREGLLNAAFMRQWKSLLESRTFDAVLVGQDTMPRFKDAYPNEFGVTHDERISYLSGAEARELAERPIMLQGESRYKGSALDRLIRLTAGSAFYLQIFCDRLVQHLNRHRLVFITESVVKDVLGQLVTGRAALPRDKFDPLITAASESVALAPRSRYMSLLTRLALEPAASGEVQEEEPLLVRDLIEREVIERDSGGLLRIRVGLFAEWLKANSVGMSHDLA